MLYQVPKPTLPITQPAPAPQATYLFPVNQPAIHGWLELQRMRNQPVVVPYFTTTATRVTSSLDWMQPITEVIVY